MQGNVVELPCVSKLLLNEFYSKITLTNSGCCYHRLGLVLKSLLKLSLLPYEGDTFLLIHILSVRLDHLPDNVMAGKLQSQVKPCQSDST